MGEIQLSIVEGDKITHKVIEVEPKPIPPEAGEEEGTPEGTGKED